MSVRSSDEINLSKIEFGKFQTNPLPSRPHINLTDDPSEGPCLTTVSMDSPSNEDAMDMDIDPTLSVNAAGLWSDEESNHDPISDVSDPELPQTTTKRKVTPLSPGSLLEPALMTRAAGRNMRNPCLPKSRSYSHNLLRYSRGVICLVQKLVFMRLSPWIMSVFRRILFSAIYTRIRE
jgi:hypothetical protein